MALAIGLEGKMTATTPGPELAERLNALIAKLGPYPHAKLNATEQQKTLLADAQTSGGLLLCVAEKRLEQVLRVLRRARTPAAVVIGRLVDSRRGPLICMTE